MVEVDVVVEALGGEFASVPAVGQELRAGADRRVVRGAEVAQTIRVGLDQQDVAVRADRRDHVQVHGLLGRPLNVPWRQRRRLALLVQLGHAPGTGTGLAWRQAIVGAIRRQIRDRLRVVKGVHHGDGLADALTGRRAGQVVRAAQVGGPVPGHGLGPGDSQAVTGARADQRQALHLAGPGRDRADAADAGQFRRLRRGQWPLRRQRSGWCGAMPGRANGGRVPAHRRRGSGGCHRAGRNGRQCGRGQADRGDECRHPGPDAVLGPTDGLPGADGVTIAVLPVHGSIPPLTHGAPPRPAGATR